MKTKEWLKSKINDYKNPDPSLYKSRLYNSIALLVLTVLFWKFVPIDNNKRFHMLFYIAISLNGLFYAYSNFVLFKDKSINIYLKILSSIISLAPIILSIIRFISLI